MAELVAIIIITIIIPLVHSRLIEERGFAQKVFSNYFRDVLKRASPIDSKIHLPFPKTSPEKNSQLPQGSSNGIRKKKKMFF